VAETVVVATTDVEYAAFGELISEYQTWLLNRYADIQAFMAGVLRHQALDKELNELPERYGPPEGKTLLTMRDGEVSGGVAYHDLHDGSCEMKRMYIPERFQGQGTGRLLCTALIAEATADGYRLMRLDTGFRNTEAIAMYESLGFRMCAAYQDYPENLLVHLRFMERPLVSEESPT
jgi:ribosomal protein S18 acetylase RimI-like enzyme